MNENTKKTLDAIISSKQNDVENALKDFVTDNNIMYSAILVSRKKSYFAGDFVMNVINLARAIKKSPVARKCVEEALSAANGNYDYIQKRFKKGQDIEGIINIE